ncbi:MAG: hypothetical protein OXN88_11805 [Chloroflexota bacterium]|nr:hypothetical protein [Chloroflexota bacterium]
MTMPLVLYTFHRGVVEGRQRLIVVSGLLTAVTTVISMYVYVCAVITVSLAICAFATSRWGDIKYWRLVALLVAVAAFGSAWRLAPILMDAQGLGETLEFHDARPAALDVLHVFINFGGPVIGEGLASLFQQSTIPRAMPPIYLGLLPLALIALGLRQPASRRKMMPWILLYALFLILSLGDFLNVAGIKFQLIYLPKHYLDMIVPIIFRSFAAASIFMTGAIFPAAVLVCYGLAAIREQWTAARRPGLILLLIALIGLDYHVPVVGNLLPQERFHFMDWLATEGSSDEIRLINLPMGRNNSKRYNLYQVLSGFPHAEGAISRTPASAHDYIRKNAILATWNNNRPMACLAENREVYLRALDAVEADGFSHVVLHQNVGKPYLIVDSFENAEPSYRDDFVWIYRTSDLRRSCDP